MVAKVVAKITPKVKKTMDKIFTILAIIFFIIDFPIIPISGHTTIISHISILVNSFLRDLRFRGLVFDRWGRFLGLGVRFEVSFWLWELDFLGLEG